ncbi:hypothetical protein [Candidatus Palauibacter sp.]|uniref:hypothetical protein n=1 Tax=Candidatus Palauibacter sp. TaxID=3101350 RepID=UPI003B59643C
MRDPLYRKIEQRLGERLDPHLFERCAVELLRDVYPGLAPVTGGDDAGMDGATGNAAGEPLPLIVTTAANVLGNLTGSLESYRRTRGRAMEAALATSRALTPRKRRNLEARARELGFTLRNIHDRDDFTGRLYRNSKWRLELLGLPGDPPALSALPRSVGPHRTSELIGRDEELNRLRGHRGDALIVGQPGVGKTALFMPLTREGEGLFVVSDDPGQIADAFRDNPVRLLFVDDAHLREPLLDLLMRLREEPGFDFRIAASTWPTRAEALARRLYVAADGVIPMGGLPRETVANIIRREQSDLSGGVIGEILNQTEDPRDDVWKLSGSCRPGLALTLARHTSRWGLKKLVGGGLLIEGLSRDARLSGAQLDCMATFALGGMAGMKQAEVAQALNLPEVKVRSTLGRLAGTGTLTDTRGALAVRPRVLRGALVARTFFCGGTSLSLERALERVEDAVACTETLLDALSRGAAVPHEPLQARLEDHRRAHVGDRVLDLYAGTGAEGAKWVLERYPDRASSVASEALRFAPDWALRRLLALALASDEESRDGCGDPEARTSSCHPPTVRAEDLVSAVDTWVRAGWPGSSAVIRRQTLLRALSECGESARDSAEVAVGLVRACFSLSFMAIHGDSVSRNKFGMAMGSVTEEDVRCLARLWPEALRLLRDLGDPGMGCVRDVIQEWAAGARVVGKRSETKVASRAEVSRMLEQALEAWREPGFLHWASSIAREQGLDVEIQDVGDAVLSRWIDALYPPASADPRARRRLTSKQRVTETRERLQSVEVEALRLAGAWCQEEPETVVDRMMGLKRQAEVSGRRDTRPMSLIAGQLAELVSDPSAWLDASANCGAPGDWVGSFLAETVRADPTGEAPWRTLDRHDPERRYAWMSLQVGIRVPNLPSSAVRLVMEAARQHAGLLRQAVPWADVSVEWGIRLLGDRNEDVRGETAFALWDLHHRSRPPGDLGVLWEDAAVTCGGPELLHDVLRADAAAAVAWLIHEAEESARRKDERTERADELMKKTGSLGKTVWHMLGESFYSLDTELLAAACDTLGPADRQRLLRAIPAEADPRFLAFLRVAGEHGCGDVDSEHYAW